MSANPPVFAEPRPSAVRRYRWLIIGAAALAGAAIAALVARSLGSSGTASSGPPEVTSTWAAGERRAPAFALQDQNGHPLSLVSLRGRPAIVTFIDPLCRDFCPREASVLSEAAAGLGKDAPAIVSVSVESLGEHRPRTSVRTRPTGGSRRAGAGVSGATPSSPACGTTTASGSG